ncbi:uncharacterized protein EAF01_001178 [Botrytis porri]|uniref:uncharacterized protein n=1 Tax=Botrytis porri TaxID=87229 RepID=UPI0019021315|nr:uncharacterized protein EAF01_001178 [Botrytis porri]KAF7912157.1 hypothetical protein EAF01_001178 [Botrytis porri]
MPPLPPPKKSTFPLFSNEMSYHETPFFEATLHETHPYVPYAPARPQKEYLAIPAVPSGAPMQPISSKISEPPLLLILFVCVLVAGYAYRMFARSTCGCEAHRTRYRTEKAATCGKYH